MGNATVYNAERNGYSVRVFQYTVCGAMRYTATVTNLTTGSSEQTPGWCSRAVAVEVAQDMADAGNI